MSRPGRLRVSEPHEPADRAPDGPANYLDRMDARLRAVERQQREQQRDVASARLWHDFYSSREQGASPLLWLLFGIVAGLILAAVADEYKKKHGRIEP